jgi:hypothetical protein
VAAASRHAAPRARKRRKVCRNALYGLNMSGSAISMGRTAYFNDDQIGLQRGW